MTKTLLFDFDGTLADSFAVAAEIFYELTGHARIDDPVTIQRLRRMPVLKVAKEIGITPWQIPRLLVQGRKAMNKHMPEVQPFPGIVEALQELHERGHKMYIISSNSSQNVTQFLRTHNLEQYFVKVYGGIGVVGKAGAIRKVLRQNDLHREDCLYIGDEIRDIEGARKADIQVVSVTWGYNDAELLQQHSPNALVDTPQEMIRIVQTLQ